MLSILYVGYISMQVPSYVSYQNFHIGIRLNLRRRNMLLNHIGKPSIYLPACMAVWGVVSLMTGFATR